MRRDESIGHLAPSLAHDLNNLLSVICCSSEVLANEAQNQRMLLLAQDAMPQGGQLTIGTRDVRLGEEENRASSSDGYVAVTVSDTGVGMSREVRDRMFERLFTTKGAARGTGLGLSTVRRFASDCGGCLSVHSAPGLGTTLVLYVPRACSHEPEHRPSDMARCRCV